MTSVGQDYAPYVFLLTEDGNVEYIDVISGAQCGTMANGGPLYGVNEIVKFEIGTAYDADFERRVYNGVRLSPATMKNSTWSRPCLQCRPDGAFRA